MGPILRLQPKLNIEQLYEQLDYSQGVLGKGREFVTQYLLDDGVDNLEDITVDDLKVYRKYVKSLLMINKNQKKYFMNLLEQVTFAYLIAMNQMLDDKYRVLIPNRAVRNKTVGFMLTSDVTDASGINYDLRSRYQMYLSETIAESKVSEYIKAMDILKLESIRIQNGENPLRVPELKYEGKEIFLLYHPSYEIARTFYYIRDKEELLFDFSVATSAVLKRQIFKMLKHVLETKDNRHDRRERFIVPLKMLYQYCIRSGIGDIEQITEKEIEGFRRSMDGKVGTKTDTYMQIVDNICMYLFLDAKHTNWKANAWYLERFDFEDGRMNPAREIKRFTFGQIENTRNRDQLKNYMKYQIGVSQKSSLQTIRAQYYDILSHLKYLDAKKINVTDTTAEEMESYIQYLDGQGNQPEAFNRSLISIARFYGYMLTQKEIFKAPVYFDYYFKKTFMRHNDRTVSEEKQMEVLKCLKKFPIHIRLMYLNLWCIGLRVNEVCVIKGGAYYWDGKDAWIRIYQSKMKAEKYVPIPIYLYEAMQKYISENKIAADEYIFKNKRGGAYDAGTFSKQMKRLLAAEGIEGYDFKSHDFRHTVGTYLYSHGASIEAIRDYLGHKESDMTRQYLDYMPQVIDEMNEEYFSIKNNSLAKAAKRKGNE